MRVRRVLRILMLLTLIPVGLCATCSGLYWFVWCGHEKLAEVPSPSGRYITYEQYDDCVGATGWGYSSVGVRRSFSLLGFGTHDVLLVYGKPIVAMSWLDDHTLVVHYSIGPGDTESILSTSDAPCDGITIKLDGPSPDPQRSAP